MSRSARRPPHAPERTRPGARSGAVIQRHLRAVLEHAPLVLLTLDRDGVITHAEGRGLEGLGLTPADLVDRTVLEAFPQLPSAQVNAGRVLAGESFTSVGMHAGRTFELRYEALLDRDGTCAGATVVAVDVTASVVSAARLAESEQRFQQVADHIQEVFWMYDPRTMRALYASPAFEAVFGRPRSAILEDIRALDAWFLPEDLPRVRAAAARSAAGEPVDEEFRIQRPDGAVRWIRSRGASIRDADGTVTRIAGTIEDITERRVDAEQLRLSVSRLAATLESTADGILVVDEHQRVTATNRRVAELWGVPESALIGTSLDRLLETALPQLEDPQAFVEQVLGLALEPESERFDVITFCDGRVVECYSLPQRIEGRQVGRVFSFRDVTARQRAEDRLRARDEELRHAQKMDAVGRLAGGVAHDFNNLLTAILGHAQLLLEMLPPSDPSHESAREIQNAGQRAAQLTRQLLAFGRKQAPHADVLDLDAVMDALLPMVRAALGDGVRVEVRGIDGGAWVCIDRGELEQLIMNLAVNARDAMTGSGTLGFATDRVTFASGDPGLPARLSPGSFVRLQVRDSGAGMTEAVRARVFEPFFTTKERGQGLGLGLAMAYATMMRGRGNIEVQSAPGAGATFTLLFPVATPGPDGEAAPAPVGIPGAAPRAPGRETLLVVEDEEVVRRLLARMFEGLGYRVVAVASSEEALERIGAGADPIDLLVTDLVMRGRSGLELAEELRRRRPGLPVVCISGYANEEMARRMSGLPRLAFLQKPFMPAALARLVREHLDRHGADPA